MRRGLAIAALLVLGCETPPINECGGDGPLGAAVGDACGDCGAYVCDGPHALRCEGAAGNACGGCDRLVEAPGAACGACDSGALVCDGADALRCEGESTNACGGCAALAEAPGALCDACGATWVCDGADAIRCDTSTSTINECGSCGALGMVPGEACGDCGTGTVVCDASGGVLCEAGACGIGSPCETTADCTEGHCSRGLCAPAGFVHVPAGTFTMGAPLSERGRHPLRENGQHSVTLTRAFYAGETTVTQGEWFSVIGNRPSFFAACGDDCPVESVTYWEMLLYADALSRAQGLPECYGLTDCTGVLGEGCAGAENCTGFTCATVPSASLDCEGYRLPTEAEWEYMARAGTSGAFLTASGDLTEWGSSPVDPELDLVAWYGANAGVTYAGALDCSMYNASLTCGTHPVAQKQPNAWDLFDMTGNVWERVFDYVGDYPAPGAMVTDPVGPASGTHRRMRGGPFNAWGQYLRVAYRTGPIPEARWYNIGFRVVRTVLAPE